MGELTREALHQFVGTAQYFPTMYGFYYTDGVHYIAEEGQAYWLIDAIGAHVVTNKKLQSNDFQIWTLKVADDMTATLTCHDDKPGRLLVSQEIPWTDFPLNEIEIWCANGVMYLPSEH